jgi:hypothetical protein
MDVHPSSASTDFSSQHFYSAQFFAQILAEVEGQPREPEDHEANWRYQALASGAVLSAAAFLEAYINELFSHCALTLGGAPVGGLTSEQQATLGRMWRRGIPRTARYSILEKYEVALDLLAKEPFDRGAAPYQDASALTELRNALVHYEPEFYPIPHPLKPVVPQAAMPGLEKRLRGKFTLSPFADPGYPFFPDHCLSAGSAAWSVQSALAFVEAFLHKAGIVERFKYPLGKVPSR